MSRTSPEHYQLVETRLQQKLDTGSTRCNLCLWHCKISHGQRGFCQAHVNRHGTLYNLSYGILSAIDIGGIEDKPVRHYRPGTKVMSVGSFGCNFRCPGCHNPEISWGVTALEQLAKGQSQEVFVTPQALVDTALKFGAQGIAFTYSEPAVWLEYVIDVSRIAKKMGLYTVYVSNSFVSDEALREMAPYIDVLCSDIKSMRQAFYKDICSVASLEDVLHCIELAQELGVHVEVRTNIIPSKNDDESELLEIAQWVKNHLGVDCPWHITKFFPAFKLAHIAPTGTEIMLQAYEQAKSIGLRHVYVYDDKGCDCAETNLPVTAYLEGDERSLISVKQCSANCCGDEGVLLKKYEQG